MIDLKFDRLWDQQPRVWKLRYRDGWRMNRIAIELGISRSRVCKMIVVSTDAGDFPSVEFR